MKAQALNLLHELGVRWSGSGDMLAVTFLVYAGMLPCLEWKNATAPLLTITQAMERMRYYWDVAYAPNTRESVRFSAVNVLVRHRILVENPDQPRPKQSPKFCYQLEPGTLTIVQLF